MPKNTGKRFESEVYDAIKSLLDNGQLGLLPNSCKVFKGKGYYSKDRDADIITDVSVEVYVGNSTTPSIIWIWECKDYGKSLPVDDVEEFHSKLSQIGGDRTKGTIITSNGAFQDGALKFAGSKGIGLARLLPEEQVKWVMYLMTSNMRYSQNNNTLNGLRNISFVSHGERFFGLTSDSKLTNYWNLDDFIDYELKLILKQLI
ncbi:restriction endonuclease [Sedimentibacter hydroxybenzoicus DSM 7310]|uniref:Restriction endonuclease n=1 Tax=Sedimentibacter hydroxybenzoicus DSM 7310 TaxID=1123245 RepID=A0A974BKS9_SEDHY|nr:restriction endonuclease [Sedimentibacter hydroxybenzoicus]NYB74989.1 restriction endonuclease [Sedimentibacter hydroxybenzoicus DSM 7310]